MGVSAQGSASWKRIAAAGSIAALVVVAGLLVRISGASAAITITVLNTNDSGPGSLRLAVANAESGDTIKVPAGKYVLTSGELLVNTRVRIEGVGARKTIIDGNGASRIFEIPHGGSGTVLSRLTAQHGNAGDDNGGGIALTDADLRLQRVALKKNRVNFNDNFSGGGIDATGTTHVVIARSVVSGNRGYNGGGMDDISELRVVTSTIAGNSAGGPNSNGDGGAIEGAGSVTIVNSTIAGNRCFNGRGCGGGLFADATAKGSIIARNLAFDPNGKRPGSPGNPGTEDNCVDALASQGHNLEGRKDCGLSKPSDLQRTNPLLKKLGDYGGQTNTRALRGGSPAVDAGARKCGKKDQRGVHRPQGRRCDIGAFERAS